MADREGSAAGVDGDPLDLVDLMPGYAESPGHLRVDERVRKAAGARWRLQRGVWAELPFFTAHEYRGNRAVGPHQGLGGDPHTLAEHEILMQLRRLARPR